MTLARSSHGTIVAVQLTPSASFTDIAELGDISLPGMERNEFDAVTQNINIDAYVLGILRREPVMVPLNFLPSNSTHDHLTGVQYLCINNTVTGWRFTVPAISGGDGGIVWIASGQVKSVSNIKAPADGKLSAELTIRLSGLMTIGAVTVGT